MSIVIKEIKKMDNEGLLAWSEHEVERAREALERAIAHTGELRETVRLEKEAKRELVEYLTVHKMLGVDMLKIWKNTSKKY
jgi:hypothetical protein